MKLIINDIQNNIAGELIIYLDGEEINREYVYKVRKGQNNSEENLLSKIKKIIKKIL